MKAITGKTKIVGILGYPVGHTLSPIMHNTAFQTAGLDWKYIPLPVTPEKINDAACALRTFNFMGANVTVPHKQAIMRQMDELDISAREIGAVNTIALKNNRLIGYNTDADGFLQSLLTANFNPKGTRVLVLGAGGAARAVLFALANAGAKEIAVYNRTVERAAFLVDDLSTDFTGTRFSCELLSPQILHAANNHFDLVVNTTSLGMSPHTETSPWAADIPLPENALICDLVYNPLKTQFLRQAENAGLPTVDGVGMLIHQGAKAFKIWTGEDAPIEAMRQAVLEKLKT